MAEPTGEEGEAQGGSGAEADFLLESFPDEVEEALAQAAAERLRLTETTPGLEFIVSDMDRWVPGSTVTVAFYGGDTNLHRLIADTVAEIDDACSLTVDFGYDPDCDTYRTWSPSDEDYVADIRVSFDHGGYWSLVGTASINPFLTPPSATVGGLPHQRSLNLGGYDENLPNAWRGTVLHEFMHALAFQHEHQNLRGPCQDEFRWEDDPGYQPTQENGRFVSDANGRRPGIYTYLGGAPNNWSQSKIDHNLRPGDPAQTVTSIFDAASVMLYRFPPLFYRSNPSPCAPSGDGQELSEGDRRGLDLLYPQSATARADFAVRAGRAHERVVEARAAQIGLESVIDITQLEALEQVLRRQAADAGP